MMADTGLYSREAMSQAVGPLNQAMPISVLVKAAVVGHTPAITIRNPLRTTISAICRRDATAPRNAISRMIIAVWRLTFAFWMPRAAVRSWPKFLVDRSMIHFAKASAA